MQKNKNCISIEEGIEKLKELTISEKNKKILNNKEKIEQKIMNNKYNNYKNASNIKYLNKFQNIYKSKRNYISLLNSNEKFFKNAKKKNEYGAKNKNCLKDNKNDDNTQNSEEDKKDKDYDNDIEKNKIELKCVDIVAEELLKSKNEDELKKYLFEQLQMLDNKKRIDKNIGQIKYTINQLDKDKNDLRKCNIGVSRALNKKIVDNNRLDREIKNLENNINSIRNNIKYYESLGDSYLEELHKLKSNKIL